jgi:hypothetical protein
MPLLYCQRDKEWPRDFVMKVRTLSAILLMISVMSASAAVTIYDDRGGQIGDYLAKYQALRASGERVVVDGVCASACTMVLGEVPRSRICVTPRAVFQFHTAWDPTPGGQVVNSAGNRILWSNYPSDVRNWISRHGGLRPKIIDLRGPELTAMFPSCR